MSCRPWASRGWREVGAGRHDHLPRQDHTPIRGGRRRPHRNPSVPPWIPFSCFGPHVTGELADGWIGNSFFPENADVFFAPIREAAAEAGRAADEVELTVAVGLEFTDDVEAAGRRQADGYAFTVLNWAGMVKVDLSKWPKIQAFQARVAARPGVQKALKAEGLA